MTTRLFLLFFFLLPLCAGASEGIPVVVEVTGQPTRFDEKEGTFVPLVPGYSLIRPTLVFCGEGTDLILSFPGKIAARIAENTRVVVGPAANHRYELDLQLGTVSALLDPRRDLSKDPVFAIRTQHGVTEAVGTFYAVTEYKGQTYAAVKTGKVSKRIVPPSMEDFASYAQSVTEKSEIPSPVEKPDPVLPPPPPFPPIP